MKSFGPVRWLAVGAVAVLLVALAFGKGLASARGNAPAAATPCVAEMIKTEVERQVQGVRGELRQEVSAGVKAEIGRMAAARRAKPPTAPSAVAAAAGISSAVPAPKAAPATKPVTTLLPTPASRPAARAATRPATKSTARRSQDASARVNATVSTLAALRAQFDRYALQHSGHFPTLAQLQDGWGALVGRTDDWGRPGGRMGPYLGQVPRNAFNGSAKVAAFGKGSAEVGWVYDEKTHRLKAVVPASVAGMFEEGLVEVMR